MCDFENGFILCSCKEKNGKSELSVKKAEYVWELRTLQKTELAVGKARWPSSDIGKGLDAAWLLLNLADRNCFDFDYQPKEEDNLVLYPSSNEYYNQYVSSYLSFIYKNGEWVEDYYDEISQETKQKDKGIVKATPR